MSLGTYGKVGVLGGILALAGAILPWWNVSANAGGYASLSLPVLGIFTLGGILALVMGILGIYFATRRPSTTNAAIVLVAGALTAVASLIWGAMVPTVSVSAGGASAGITAGFGYWITLVGGVVLLLAGVLGFGEAKKAPGPVPAY